MTSDQAVGREQRVSAINSGLLLDDDELLLMVKRIE